ncbi:DUF2169 family type VI secretion system accessory protein [Pseudomonas frederiksbergensis]|uniref:DUF2169 domain-containing protein n=1 Tax=Pseudomonas frederiksbergensis TaxID=104087 RepID=A0A423HIV0_9PSED|nr:DUF2169 domain-containing protein [Pseudomonas frederiksbergensis]RON13132.1 hypothetical protein BK662_18325 [Pseudomonas frederiksbergensis]RON14252.1 hypothetical protein BK662_24370 [Pseudomonas frederiksbergensis]
MRFTKVTPFEAAWTMGFQRDGCELLVVIVKATYRMPSKPGQPAQLHVDQQPLIEADEFIGEPGVSAPLRESDFAHFKPACDVLVIGQAHVPDGGIATHLHVGLRVGTLIKHFNVVGDRHWRKSLLGTVSASEALPFTTMPVGYERAFGGIDATRLSRTGKVATFLANPAGRGYWRHTEQIDGQPLPNTEDSDRPVTRHNGKYRPMALTPIGRSWGPRQRYAGTYDEHWLNEQAPFWPDDFDERYFQAAPEDQIIPYPQGGEDMILKHLTHDGLRTFHLPRQTMPVTFIPYRGRDINQKAVLDTIVLEPDSERFTMTWRTGIALNGSVFEIKETIVGEMSEAWHRTQRFPYKTYYRSLSEAVAAKRKRMVR